MRYTTVNIVSQSWLRRKSPGIAENVHNICGYYRISAENLQVLQKMCRRSAGINENVHKICRYYRKCAEDLQVLQKMCIKSAGTCITENVHKIAGITEYSVIPADLLHIFCNTCRFYAYFLQYLQIFCTFSVIPADFMHIFINTCRSSAHFL